MDNLDLHGVRHAEVPREVDKFIGGALMGGAKHAEIVTGHSEEMKRIVNKTLGDYGLIGVEGFMNKGTLLIELV